MTRNRRSLSFVSLKGALFIIFSLLFSYQSHAATFAVNHAADTVDTNPGDGVCADSNSRCTLRAAVMETNALAGNDSIELPANVYTLSIAGTGEDSALTGDLDITGNLIIDGTGNIFAPIIDADQLDRVFHVHSGVVVFRDVTVQNGSSQEGGGILNLGTLTLENSEVNSNSAIAGGGGIFNWGGLVEIIGSSVVSNKAAFGLGGGIHNRGGHVQIKAGSMVAGNVASTSGGGILNQRETDQSTSGLLEISDSVVISNVAERGEGGGIYNTFGHVRITDGSVILDNAASTGGGGIYNSERESRFSHLPLSLVEISDSALISNFTNGASGGGIFNGGQATLTRMTVDSNYAADGGGILNQAKITIVDSTISDNTVGTDGNGAGIINRFRETDPPTMNIVNSTISGNAVGTGGTGAGIYIEHGTVTLNSSTLSNNNPVGIAGGFEYADEVPDFVEGALNLSNTIIANSVTTDCDNDGYTISTNVASLIEDNTCNPAFNGDPLLGSLQNNGGPTMTHALLSGSIAIDMGDNTAAAALSDDQRGAGFSRVVNGQVDIGAFEFSVEAPSTTPNAIPTLPFWALLVLMTMLVAVAVRGSGIRQA